jgi:hypothetical protein
MFLRWPLCLLLLSLAFAAHAQADVHRCIGADGQPVFTDQPCSTMQATPMPRRSLGNSHLVVRGICPTTAADLQQRIGTAFLSHNANRLASLMQWRGYDQSSALAVMRQLDELVNAPLQGIDEGFDEFSTPPAPASSIDTQSIVPTLTLRLGASADAPARRITFQILDRAGCLWLLP